MPTLVAPSEANPDSARTADGRVKINCSSANCVQLATGNGEPVYTANDNQHNVFITYQNGQLRKLDPSTGANTLVSSGLGNLRGLALDGLGSAYVAN